jgi:glycerol-3-phosphate dehydrogenase (NAD(P)+)
VAPSLKYFPVDERHRAKFSSEVKIQSTAILGAGSWGTALAALWGKDNRDLQLWGRNQALVEELQTTRKNPRYLPAVEIPNSVNITSDLKECARADLIVFVTPSAGLRAIANQLRESSPSRDAVLLSCTKGIEHGTGLRMSEILREHFPHNPVAVISGPNLAVEVSRELPTATVLACTQAQAALELQSYLGSPRFRIYTTGDLIGIELGGALKNIFAIAAGVSDGFGLGDNTKAALLTRSLAEMIRVGLAMGGKVATFYGLSGAGDLIATAYSKHSRNRRVGEQLGRGESLQKITSSMRMVAEGIPTTKSAYECARKLDVETPVIDQIYAALYQGKALPQAMEELLGRDQKAEGF